MKRVVALFALLTFAVAVPSASAAEFGIVPGSLAVRMLDAEGHQEDRAGSHPDRLQVDFALNVEGTGTSVRDIAFEMPPGFGGNPGAVPECLREVFEKGECPPDTQVGTITLSAAGGQGLELPIFQLEPGPGEVAAFGSTPAFDAPLTMELRPDDFGITFRASDLPQVQVSEGHFELWGVPADHQEGTGIPRRPFLTAPTRCGPLAVTFRTRSWQEGAPWLSETAETEAPLTGCKGLAFDPRLGLELSNPQADSPTGARIDLNMSENDDPDGLASAQLENATIELPAGVTVSPGGIGGLTACSDAELGLGEAGEARCPPSSRVGTAEFASPELREPLVGAVYLGQERPGERFRLFIVAPGPGVVVKFVSALHADPATGRLSAALRDLPQVPAGRLTLRFDDGPHALLASPLTCGSFASAGSFEPYGGGTPVESAISVTIGADAGGSQCPSTPAFSPRFVAASTRHGAGRSTALSITLLRRAGEQLPKRFAVSLPKGLSAALGNTELCPDSSAASGACPAGSRMGDVLAEVGSGSSLAALHGDVYLAGAYRRSPFSLLMAFHAAIGPFDLGTTTVRAAMQINRRTGQIAVVTDQLPELIEGFPIRFQSIGIALNRRGAMRNPTSCAPTDFTATIETSSGASTTATSPLTVNGCSRLGFKPRFSMDLGGRSELHRHGRPSLRISARFRRADTNLRSMELSLPSALKFNIAGLGEICPRQDAIDDLCSARARVGTAYARNSLLDRPLRGAIYVVQPEGEGLPDLWLSIAAMGVHADLRGRTSVRQGHVVTNLSGLPDMPLSAFAMQLRGGRHGVLSLGAEPCIQGQASQLVSRLAATGQSGARRRLRLKAKVHCGGTAPSRLQARVARGPAPTSHKTR